jgi:hypothetical protein
VGTEPVEYCRQIEAYLCQKNDGHLIRVVGPSFDLVAGWEADGIPLKIACQGIDRYFERYYRKGPRRRPVRIDFCDADVRDVFDEWRRAVGLPVSPTESGEAARPAPPSFPLHLERASLRLTAARAAGALGAEADALLDRLSGELDAARAAANGVRGEARRAAIVRLTALDGELLRLARASIGGDALRAIVREAEDELSSFRDHMPDAAYQHAREAAVDRLIRARLRLPVLAYE